MTYLGLLLLVAAGAVVFERERRRRRGEDPLGPQPVGPLPNTIVALVGALVLRQLLLWTAGAMLDPEDMRRPVVGAVVVTIVNFVVALVLVRVALSGPRKPMLPARKLALAGALGGLVAFGAVYVVGLAIHKAYELQHVELPTQDIVMQAGAARGWDLVAYAVTAIVIAPFAEEVFFRGLLLPATTLAAGERVGLLLQAALFGAIHVASPDQWPLSLPLAVVGWCAGRLYLRTGSLGAAVVLHATFNAINFALMSIGG
jgi:membrane protease YdiL (CAAX protease family)